MMQQPASLDGQLLAERWRRVLSRIVDLVALSALLFGSLSVAAKFGLDRFPINDAIVFGTLLVYEVLIPGLTGGAGIGRLISRSRVVSERDGKPSTLLNHLGRFAARAGLFSLIAVFVTYEIALPVFLSVVLVEGLVGALQPRRQTIGDLLGRTLVVKRASA